MCPVLSVERADARGDRVVIPLDSRKGRSARVRLLAPSRQDAQTHTFVLRYGPSSTILRLRAPNSELYTLWTSAIVAAMRSGHEHSIDVAELCPQCLVCHDNEVGGPLAGTNHDSQPASVDPTKEKEEPLGFNHTSITLPSSLDRPSTTLTLPSADVPTGRWSFYSSSLVVEPSSANASTLCFQLHLALLRQDFAETWVMEARKNLLLRVNGQAPRVSTWSVEAVLAVLRLRAVRTFQPAFDLFAAPDCSKSKCPADAFTAMAMALQQNVYVVADLASDCERPGELADCYGCCCRCCASKFRVYSPISGERECRTSAFDWLRKLSGEVLEALRSPVVLHVTDRSACSLLRFSELQSQPKMRTNSSGRGTIDLSSVPGLVSAS